MQKYEYLAPVVLVSKGGGGGARKPSNLCRVKYENSVLKWVEFRYSNHVIKNCKRTRSFQRTREKYRTRYNFPRIFREFENNV